MSTTALQVYLEQAIKVLYDLPPFPIAAALTAAVIATIRAVIV